MLSASCVDENLFGPIRARVKEYFRRHSISWHIANAHLLSSQVSCLNFLEPFAFEPGALRMLLQPIFGPIDKMIEPEPATDPGRLVAFEFIGAYDYLNEGAKRKRTRGANCTSVDAAVRFRTPAGQVEVGLVEWKYTESYGRPDPNNPRNQERMRRYKDLAFYPEGPLRPDCGIELVKFFAEPIYQLLRQQMLAVQMEKHRELGANRVRTALIAPRANLALAKLKIEELGKLDSDVSSAWRAVLENPDRFLVCPTENLFLQAGAAVLKTPSLRQWFKYIGQRYGLNAA